MSWFAASILFESAHTTAQADRAFWEESVVLVAAANEDEALLLAERIGRSRELSYAGQGTDLVTWSFRRVERVFAIQADTLDVGVELFSRYLRAAEVDSLLKPFE